MIGIKEFNGICQDIVEQIGIKGHVICSTEEQGAKKLKDKADIWLVAVYPNYSFDGDPDSYQDRHEMMFLVVTRQMEGKSDEFELDQYVNTQQAMVKLKEYLFGEGDQIDELCKLFPNLKVNAVAIEPEYNIFGGYLGWSMILEG